MRLCWQVDPDSRPSFQIIRNEIAKMLERSTEHYGYLPVESGEYMSEVDVQNATNIARELQHPREDPLSVNRIKITDSVNLSEQINDASV